MLNTTGILTSLNGPEHLADARSRLGSLLGERTLAAMWDLEHFEVEQCEFVLEIDATECSNSSGSKEDELNASLP